MIDTGGFAHVFDGGDSTPFNVSYDRDDGDDPSIAFDPLPVRAAQPQADARERAQGCAHCDYVLYGRPIAQPEADGAPAFCFMHHASVRAKLRVSWSSTLGSDRRQLALADSLLDQVSRSGLYELMLVAQIRADANNAHVAVAAYATQTLWLQGALHCCLASFLRY